MQCGRHGKRMHVAMVAQGLVVSKQHPTPNAKRPMDRAAVDVVQGGIRTMSIEDLSAGFVNLEKVVTRDETFASDLAGAVQYNADLLNLLVTRVNALEVSTVLSSEGLQEASDFTTEGL